MVELFPGICSFSTYIIHIYICIISFLHPIGVKFLLCSVTFILLCYHGEALEGSILTGVCILNNEFRQLSDMTIFIPSIDVRENIIRKSAK